jgi:hypothetical protein
MNIEQLGKQARAATAGPDNMKIKLHQASKWNDFIQITRMTPELA